MQKNHGGNKNQRTSANREKSKRQHRGCCFWKARARLDNTKQVSSNRRTQRSRKSTSDQFVYRRSNRSPRRSLGNAKDAGRKTIAVLPKNNPLAFRGCHAARNGYKRSSSFAHARLSAKRRTLQQGFVLENNVGKIHALRWNIMERFKQRDEGKLHKGGSFSEVREIDYCGKRVVIKRVRSNHRLAEREWTAWQLLSQNRYTKVHVCLLIDCFPTSRFFYYISPAYDIDFFYFLKRTHRYKHIFHILLQIANALVTLHSYDLAHLDIKPENILIRGNYAVLADFATVYKVRGIKKVEKRLGTLEYCAPEMLDFLITTKSDVYSFTKTIFVALQGHFPNVNAIDGSYGEQLSELYLSGLMEDPEDRCSSGDVYKKLYYISIK